MAVVQDLPKFKQPELPKFQIRTPHSGLEMTVQSMTIADEEQLKTSAVSSERIVGMLNQITYNCIVPKEAPYDTFEKFESICSMMDRTTILYGILISSYGDEQTFSTTCKNCRKSYEVKGSLSKNINMNMYTGKAPLVQETRTVELPVSKYKAVIGLPTLRDERFYAAIKGVPQDVLRKADSYLIVKKLIRPGYTMDKSSGEEISKEYVIDNIIEIYSNMQSMCPQDRKGINKVWLEEFGVYKVDVVIPSKCPQCDTLNDTYVDFVHELFRLSE